MSQHYSEDLDAPWEPDNEPSPFSNPFESSYTGDASSLELPSGPVEGSDSAEFFSDLVDLDADLSYTNQPGTLDPAVLNSNYSYDRQHQAPAQQAFTQDFEDVNPTLGVHGNAHDLTSDEGFTMNNQALQAFGSASPGVFPHSATATSSQGQMQSIEDIQANPHPQSVTVQSHTSGQNASPAPVFDNKFRSYQEAKTWRKRHLQANNNADPTFPVTRDDNIRVVRILYFAIINLHGTSDGNDDGRKPSQAWTMFRENKFQPEHIQSVCWTLLKKLFGAQVSGPLVPPMQRSTCKPAHFDTFAERLNALEEALRTHKTICKHLMDHQYIDGLVDNPKAHVDRAKSNKKVNARKADVIREGRKAKGLIKQESGHSSDEDSPSRHQSLLTETLAPTQTVHPRTTQARQRRQPQPAVHSDIEATSDAPATRRMARPRKSKMFLKEEDTSTPFDSQTEGVTVPGFDSLAPNRPAAEPNWPLFYGPPRTKANDHPIIGSAESLYQQIMDPEYKSTYLEIPGRLAPSQRIYDQKLIRWNRSREAWLIECEVFYWFSDLDDLSEFAKADGTYRSSSSAAVSHVASHNRTPLYEGNAKWTPMENPDPEPHYSTKFPAAIYEPTALAEHQPQVQRMGTPSMSRYPDPSVGNQPHIYGASSFGTQRNRSRLPQHERNLDVMASLKYLLPTSNSGFGSDSSAAQPRGFKRSRQQSDDDEYQSDLQQPSKRGKGEEKR
ncbi:MAG: hypothetical protein M1819_001387 [Sarea resinae]|nr:MAG: hypothetical protein M1819_001387 [Sarea resinae]